MSNPGAEQYVELPTLAVVGAAGMVGTHFIRAAADAPLRIRALVHSPTGRDTVGKLGVEDTIEGDLSDDGVAAAAVAGADAVFMIPPAFHPQEDEFAIKVVQEAERAGVRKFVYLSVLHPHTPGLHHHMRKANAEAAVRSAHLDWTILQPSMFAQIVLSTWGMAPGPQVPVPFDVDNEFSFIDLNELAEVAVKVCTQPGHGSATYELAGPTIPFREAVRTAGESRGVELTATTLDWREARLPPGFTESTSQATDMKAMWHDYDRHGLQGNSNVLRMLLGREPATFVETAGQFAAQR